MRLLFFVMSLVFAGNAVAQEKPNMLIIWGDDIGFWNLSTNNMGMMGYETPNIDRIANEGASLLTTMVSRAAPRVVRRSSSANLQSGLVSQKSVFRELT